MQRRSQLPDDCIDTRFDLDEHILFPKPRNDLRACDQFAATLHEQDEQVHRLALEPHGPPITTQLICTDIELEGTEATQRDRRGTGHGTWE